MVVLHLEVDDMSNLQQQANTQKRYEVTSADLPLRCPMDSMRNWDSHPSVSISIKPGEEVQCPYCGAVYHMAKGQEI